jgi:N-acetyl-gamma-glutamyl-phosphate reductase
MIRVAICGGSGYTGGELLRILARHPNVQITAVTSERSAGRTVGDLFPHLHNFSSLTYEPLNKEKLLNKAKLFFMALPHGKSQEAVDFFFRQGRHVIDLSADYRLRDADTYEKWYSVPHMFQRTLNKAVYGLPEIYRKQIRKARLIANPGCYPTGAILGLLPAMRKKAVNFTSIVIDSKSGTSGAGRKGNVAVSYCEVNEGFKAYAPGSHRHTPEIEQELAVLAGRQFTVNFTPHLLPVDRGILTTIYVPLVKKMTEKELHRLYTQTYRKEHFVRVLEYGTYPNIKNVRGTNFCDIGLKLNERTKTLIIVTAIDNLVKGASGQAVQNFNIMTGCDELTAIDTLAVFP